MVMVAMCEDNIGDAGCRRVVLACGVQESFPEEGDVGVLAFARVDKNVGVTLADEVRIRPCL